MITERTLMMRKLRLPGFAQGYSCLPTFETKQSKAHILVLYHHALFNVGVELRKVVRQISLNI